MTVSLKIIFCMELPASKLTVHNAFTSNVYEHLLWLTLFHLQFQPLLGLWWECWNALLLDHHLLIHHWLNSQPNNQRNIIKYIILHSDRDVVNLKARMKVAVSIGSSSN